MADSGMGYVCKILYQRAILLGSCRVVVDPAQEYEAARIANNREGRRNNHVYSRGSHSS